MSSEVSEGPLAERAAAAVAAAAASEESVQVIDGPAKVDVRANVKVPSQCFFPGGTCALSPFDLRNMGRAIPMCWFFATARL